MKAFARVSRISDPGPPRWSDHLTIHNNDGDGDGGDDDVGDDDGDVGVYDDVEGNETLTKSIISPSV